jgi:DNA invertase Pin-like site-specific DNA recombinase
VTPAGRSRTGRQAASEQTGAPPDTRPRYLGVARVSTDDQADNGHSLDAQDARLSEEADRRGWDVEIIRAPGRSGGKMSPELRGALDRLASGEAAGLMVAKLDRLTRSVSMADDIIKAAERQGWNLVVVDLGVDLSTPQGRMMARLVATFAEYERDLISQRTKEGLAAARAKGALIGRPPLVDGTTVARILAERDKGASFAAIAQALTEEGHLSPEGRPVWQPSTVRRIANRSGS